MPLKVLTSVTFPSMIRPPFLPTAWRVLYLPPLGKPAAAAAAQPADAPAVAAGAPAARVAVLAAPPGAALAAVLGAAEAAVLGAAAGPAEAAVLGAVDAAGAAVGAASPPQAASKRSQGGGADARPAQAEEITPREAARCPSLRQLLVFLLALGLVLTLEWCHAVAFSFFS